jgi:hypothetical protein
MAMPMAMSSDIASPVAISRFAPPEREPVFAPVKRPPRRIRVRSLRGGRYDPNVPDSTEDNRSQFAIAVEAVERAEDGLQGLPQSAEMRRLQRRVDST